jgi:hypothetical protein
MTWLLLCLFAIVSLSLAELSITTGQRSLHTTGNVSVSITPFSLLFETPNGHPTVGDASEAADIVYSYLEEVMNMTLQSVHDTHFMSIQGTKEFGVDNPNEIEFTGTVIFGISSAIMYSKEELDMVVATAFGQQWIRMLLVMLHDLSECNPYSNTTAIEFRREGTNRIPTEPNQNDPFRLPGTEIYATISPFSVKFEGTSGSATEVQTWDASDSVLQYLGLVLKTTLDLFHPALFKSFGGSGTGKNGEPLEIDFVCWAVFTGDPGFVPPQEELDRIIEVAFQEGHVRDILLYHLPRLPDGNPYRATTSVVYKAQQNSGNTTIATTTAEKELQSLPFGRVVGILAACVASILLVVVIAFRIRRRRLLISNQSRRILDSGEKSDSGEEGISETALEESPYVGDDDRRLKQVQCL